MTMREEGWFTNYVPCKNQCARHRAAVCGRSSHSVACAPSPSRRHLWQHVTNSLKEGNIDAATEHKHRLEERQRAEERQRVALTTPWKPKYFAKEVHAFETSSLFVQTAGFFSAVFTTG